MDAVSQRVFVVRQNRYHFWKRHEKFDKLADKKIAVSNKEVETPE
jgi:hypothetical protein